ncbi:hypothetical protein [Actinomadura fibrosa]|uniref:hypothetical protein n=1 Tax=Actinomadura fibrosa TaxID=111802 RepID=UPI001041291C|nr:hypothetical protein [Actinomadura fibrosa]
MEHVTPNSLDTRCAGDLYLPEAGNAILGHSVRRPRVWNAWRCMERLRGRAGVHALRDHPQQDWQHREGEQSARVPHLTPEGDSTSGFRASPRHPPVTRWPP